LFFSAELLRKAWGILTRQRALIHTLRQKKIIGMDNKFNIKIKRLNIYQHIFYAHIDNKILIIFCTQSC
jgi:hypothetical protein